MTDATSSPSRTNASQADATDAIDASCRVPLFVLVLSGALWLVIGSMFALVASIKFHAPQFLADSPFLTYGRVYPAATNSFLYGFCLQVGLAVGLWLIARLGGALLAQPWLITVGAMLWNLGVTVGVLAILAGNNTGFENLEMPGYAAVILFLGYLMIGLWGVVTFHRRRDRGLFVSQWFLFTALFWFPWIYSTANLLLISFPVRGVVQAVIAWWYSNNLTVVWLSLVGLAAVFYFVPKLTRRELHSHYLALYTYWMLILFASWGGIPNTAPVPAWMPVTSTVATVLTVIPILAVALNVFWTLRAQDPASNRSADAPSASPPEAEPRGRNSRAPSFFPLAFIVVGVFAFVLAGLSRVVGVLIDTNQTLHFTWFARAQSLLNIYGFLVMVLFGSVYYILPRLAGMDFPFASLIRVHFLLALLGILVLVSPLAIGGGIQTVLFQNPDLASVDIAKRMLPFLRVSTTGDLFLLLGHLVFLGNLAGLVWRFYRARAAAAYAVATADLFKPAEARS
jgi:cytochrome c oxidase cbb3-type subunit 1